MTRPRRAVSQALVVACVLAVSACAVARRRPADDYGVKPCPPGAAAAPLSDQALQCWFAARHGRWRTIDRESHVDVLVVRAEAWDLRDAEEIATRFVAGGRDRFAEMLVYVHAERPGERERVRRVQWTRERGFDVLDFTEPAEAPR